MTSRDPSLSSESQLDIVRGWKSEAHVCEENIQSAFFFERLLADIRDSFVVSSIGLDDSNLREGERHDNIRVKVTLSRTLTSGYSFSIVDFKLGRFSPDKSTR
jgi:hypothetical protein